MLVAAAVATISVGCVTAAETAAPGARPAAELPALVSPGDTKDDEAANQTACAKLGKKLPRLNFEGTEFQAVIQSLRSVTGASIRVKWNVLQQAGVEKTALVSINLADVTFERAIRAILDEVGTAQALVFVVDDGIITISTPEDFSRRLVTRVYDIQDLIARFPNFADQGVLAARTEYTSHYDDPGGEINRHVPIPPTVLDDSRPASKEEAIRRLLDLIKNAIDPESWRPRGELADIQDFDGQLVVTQTRENHLLVERLLWSLEPEWTHELRAKLRKQIARVNLDKAKFQDAVKFIRETSGANVVVDPHIMEGFLPPITVQAERLTGEQVLNLLTRMTRLQWRFMDGAVYVSPEASPQVPARTPASSRAGGE
jgi:type II secretory pathway component GspD/PulD (secretin)